MRRESRWKLLRAENFAGWEGRKCRFGYWCMVKMKALGLERKYWWRDGGEMAWRRADEEDG